MEKIFDLDERLINFAALIIDLAQYLPNTFAGKHLSGQIIRSSTSPALQYGEAHAAESPDDFIHKMKLGLKELRETFNALKLVRKMNWISDEKLLPALDENNQLIAIFVTSISTARRNKQKK